MTESRPGDVALSQGMAFLKLRDHLLQAESCFREGLGAEPDHPGCLLYLAVTLRNMGRFKEADRMLLRALEVSPADPLVHMQVGTLRRWQKRLEESLEAYDAALKINPRHVDTRVARAITLQEMNRWEDAIESYDLLMTELSHEEIERNVLPRRRREVAEVLTRIKGSGVDTKVGPQALAVELYRRANRLVIEGDLDAAVLLYEDAARLKPDYSDPAFPIGETVSVQMARMPDGEFLSCQWIEGCLYLHPTNLGFCCTSHPGGKSSPTIGTYHGGPIPIDFVLARRHQLRCENQAGADNACKTCLEARIDSWKAKTRPLDLLLISNHTLCTQKCIYCDLADANFEMPAYYYMAEQAIKGLLAHDWLAADTYVIWGGGEPTASKEFANLARRLFDAGSHLNIYTNATRVVPVLLDALREGRCDIVTSVDAGTPETFYRMKYRSNDAVPIRNRPAWDVVWSNIQEYTSVAHDRVVVKYVFTQGNIEEADIDGFLLQCIARGVSRIILAIEVGDMVQRQVPEKIWQAIRRTREGALGKNLCVYFNPTFFRNGGAPIDLMELMLSGATQRVPGSVESLRGHGRYLDIVGLSVTNPLTSRHE